jgi:hypothetical protein
LLQEESLLDDLGLLLGDLELPGESVDGAFGIIHMGLGGNHEPVTSPLGLADNAPQDVGELVHDLAGDVLVTGIHGGLGDQSVGTDQPVIEGLDGQGQDPDLGVGDGNAGNDLVLLSQVKGLVVFRHFQHHHLLVQGELNFTGRVESVFQYLGQHLHMVDGRVPLGEHSPKPIGVKPAKESFPLLAFLFDPVIQVLGLQFFRAPGQIRVRHPQAVGQKTLGTGGHFDLFAGYPHLGQAVEFHFIAAARFRQND